MKILAIGITAFSLSSATLAQEPAPSPNEIVDQARPEEWKQIAVDDLLVMTLAPDRNGNAREVVIQLMPAPFSQGWVENVKLLARSGYYDGLSVIRVQDNYVTQWGDPAEEEADARPLPEGLKVMGEEEYAPSYQPGTMAWLWGMDGRRKAEQGYDDLEDPSMEELEAMESDDYQWEPDFSDQYSSAVGFVAGMPVAVNLKTYDAWTEDRVNRPEIAWPVHCYAMVGVARGMSPNTGDGSSLYTVIGHAPRHLDRNIALVGRVIEGMEHLSSLPRGKGTLGFYAEDEQDKRTPILSVILGSETGEFPPPIFQYLSTESATFAKYAEARANRRDPFFIHPAGGADICNIPVPVRRVPSE